RAEGRDPVLDPRDHLRAPQPLHAEAAVRGDAAMDWCGRRVGVMGLGLSGSATARFLLGRGAEVVVSEARPEADLGGVPEQLRAEGAIVECGGHRAGVFAGCETLVISPGVPPRQPALDAVRRAGTK